MMDEERGKIIMSVLTIRIHLDNFLIFLTKFIWILLKIMK